MRWVGVVAVVSACSFEHGSLSPIADATTEPDVLVPDVPPGVWSPPVDIGISSPAGDDDPSLTDDMTELYFGSRRVPASTSVGDENIYVVKRATITDPWSLPAPVVELNTINSETTTKVTGDGLTIFFTSDRGGDPDIYMSTRNDRNSPWSNPVAVDALNSSDGDWAAYAQKTLTHVVFCSGPDTLSEALYVSDRSSISASWSTPTRVAELDEAGVSECDPMEPRAGVMYYDSWRLNADKTYDIYRVERSSPSVPWGNRTKVEGINTDGHHDRDPWVSPDEHTMFFSSTRGGSGDRIYMSTR